ncbi:hypothetical protein CFC21_069279 [Triticum aestivum]|uniref:tRNA (guanosine(18)-2'-O)-methyltransferase TARBP1 n=3 Tax=Triticum TaxID=4564 RepID=A0A3B6KV23_WHEAT|nr:uncharacterized protein LOC123106138 [Triticum aestivum]KAF7062705.1 hypothetical protein CFC21_069279 [Triticum aestivum]
MALAALESCFRAVPPEAVAAVVDCVLASSPSASPSEFFRSLLDSFPKAQDGGHGHAAALSHAAALCHLLPRLGDDPRDALRALLWGVFLPLLRREDAQPSRLQQQATALMCDAVSSARSWDLLGATILPFCVRSCAAAMALPTTHQYDGDDSIVYRYHWDAAVAPDDGLSGEAGLLPLSRATALLASLLGDALKRRRETHEEGADASLDALVQNLTWDLSRLVLKMFDLGQEYRSCATRVLLQPMLTSLADVSCVTVEFGAVQLKLSRSGFLESIWNSCVSLFSLGRPERLDAYAILSLYFSVLKSGHQGAIPGADEVQNFDLRNVTEFWDELRRGLVDKDSSIRKQAFYVLKTSLSIFSFGNDGSQRCSGRSPAALPGQDKSNAAVTKKERWANKEAKSLGVEEIKQSDEQCSSGQDRWKVFLLLYEMLQEFGTHLVEAAWAHQVLLLFESTPQSDYLNHISYRAFHAQMESVEGIFNWMTVLWERGFTQDNPQVRCLVMQSFLDIEWERYKGYAQMVPRGFVLGPLIRGLNDVVHHKDFGVGGVYNSEAIKGAERFFSNYARKLTIRERLHLVWSLASAAKQDSFGRPGLMTLAFCTASCACQSDTHDLPCGSAVNELAKCNGDTSIAVNTADFLDALWVLSERSKHHFNPKYRLKVCEQVIKAVASLTSAAEIPLNQLFNFISTIPRECTDSTGPLRGTVQKWLLQKKECSERNTLLDELIDFPTTFMKHTGIEGSYLYDDEDVGAWEAEARRWARTLLLVTSEEHHFKQIFTFLENCGIKLSEHSSTRKCADVKFFIIIICLIEELEVRQKKLVHQNNAIAGGGSDMTNGLEHHALTQMFEKSLLSVLENMVAFSKQSCSVFWLKNTDMDLPCSIKGKLGGPSQRRLATSITSSVLQCIWSMRCASSVVSWCNHYTSDVSFHSAFSFLWEFCWEVIQHCTYATETGAELHLAAYEALAYVLAALCTAPFSQFLDFVEAKQTNQTIILSLDLLATTFLGNINNLLTNGVLTRSRRAVLMCWKWLCVDSLLSISGCCDENESQMKTLGSFYSDSTLQSIFLDITESLENAGENSVVSILRCVRSVLGLIHLNRSHQNLSSLGISYEMMMQLVKSSWVLHLSCNKRRVTPIAALLSAILHPSIFPNLEMHQTNEKGPGPLKWFVETLLNEGSKSPRTIRLAALHLSGLWLMYPKTLRFYMEELKLLALYGSVAFDEDFEAELSENHEARFEVSMLAQSPDREFTEVFINTELYARVSVAALFHQLWKQIKEKSKLEAEEALQCGKLFLLKLLDSAVNDNDLSKELYKKYSSVHRRKVRVWQMICVLSHYVEEDIVEEVTSTVHPCLYRNNLPAVRQYLETFAILIYLKFPTLAEAQLVPIFNDHGMRQQALSSYVFIAANVILHSGELVVQRNHLNQLLPPIISFLTSHHHSLRSFTQLLVHAVFSKLWHILQLESSENPSIERRCFQDLKKYLAENTDCARLRVSIEGFLDVFDPDISGTPPGIFTARIESSGFECVPVSVLERVNNFLNDVREELRHSMIKDSATIKNEGLAVRKHEEGTEEKIVASQDFQKKIIPHRDSEQAASSNSAVMGNNDISRLLFEMEEDDDTFNLAVESRKEAAETVRQSRQDLIVVASLVERIPNLAGLTRTCEIFRAGGLAVGDMGVVQDKQFRLISVTAEKWVPMVEVPVESVRAFLQRKRAEGYTVVGLEQTANSVALDEFVFPAKTVVVLGREKEGIPVDIIQEAVDVCVEIPQLGVVRSLNVHVSAAIAIWDYTRQQRARSSSSSSL